MIATSADGVPIAYTVAGAGPPLVLLHGFTETGASWQEAGYVDRFLRIGRQVVLIDCRGHGGSGKPHEAAAYGGDKRARDVIAVLDALGIGVADLAGFSMGGLIALATALRFPERVRRLIGSASDRASICRTTIPPRSTASSASIPIRPCSASPASAWPTLIEGRAEALPLPEASVDTAVVTYALCTIPDPGGALREIRRVLKPGGRLLFIEHERSAEPWRSRWQDRLNGVWGRIAGGCHLNRRPLQLIEEAGFVIGARQRERFPLHLWQLGNHSSSRLPHR